MLTLTVYTHATEPSACLSHAHIDPPAQPLSLLLHASVPAPTPTPTSDLTAQPTSVPTATSASTTTA